MIYNSKGIDKGLRIHAYYDNGWHAEIENNEEVFSPVALPYYVKHREGVKLWVRRWVAKHAKGQRCSLDWLFNHDGEEIGLIVSVYTQGSQWIADVTTDKMDHWREYPLHYSIRTFDDVVEWAMGFTDGERLYLQY